MSALTASKTELDSDCEALPTFAAGFPCEQNWASMIADYLRLVSWKGDDGAAIRVGLDSIAALLSRARSAEALCRGMPIGSLPVEEAQKALLADISPIDDTRSTTHYRIVVTQNVLGKMLQE